MPSKNSYSQEQSLYPEFHASTNLNNPINNIKMMKTSQNESQQLKHPSLPISTIITNNEMHDTEENSLETEASTFPEFLIRMKERIEEEVDSNDDVRPHYHSLSSFSISTTTTTTTTNTTTAVPTPTIRPYSISSSNSGIKNRYKHNSQSSRNSLLTFTSNYTLTKQSIKNIISQTILSQTESPKMLFSPLKDMRSSTSKRASLASYPRSSLSSQSQFVQHKNEDEGQNEEDLIKRNPSFVNNHRPSSSLINEIEIASNDEINTISNDTINTIANKISKEDFSHQDNSNSTNNISDHTIQNGSNEDIYRDSFDSIPLSPTDDDDNDHHQQNYSFQYTFQYYLLQIFDKLLLRNEQVKRYRAYQGEGNDKSLRNPLILELFLQVLLDTFSRKFINTPGHHRQIDEPWITVLFIYFNRFLLQKQLKRPTLLPFKTKNHNKNNQYKTILTQRNNKGILPINKFAQVYKGELHSFHLRNRIKNQINNNTIDDDDIHHLKKYEKELWLSVKTLSKIQLHIHKRYQEPHSKLHNNNICKKRKRGLSRISKIHQPKPVGKKETTSSVPSSPSTIPVNITSNPNSFLNYYMQYKKNKERQTLSKSKRNPLNKSNTMVSHELKERDYQSSRKINPVVFKHKDSLKCYHSNNTKKHKAKNKENIQDIEEKKIGSIKEENEHQVLYKHPPQKEEILNTDTPLLPKYELPSPFLSLTKSSPSASSSKESSSASSTPHHQLKIRNCSVPMEAIQNMEMKYQHSKKPKTDEQVLSSFYRFLVKEDQEHRQRRCRSSKNDHNIKGKEDIQDFNEFDKDTRNQKGKNQGSYSSFFSYDSGSFYEHELHNSSDCSESVKENDSDIESECNSKKDAESVMGIDQKDKLQSFAYDDEELDDFISLNENPKSFCGSSVSSISLTSFSGISFHEQSSDDEEVNEQDEEKEEEKEIKIENEKEKEKAIDIDIRNHHNNSIENDFKPKEEKEDNNLMMIKNNPLKTIPDHFEPKPLNTPKSLNLPRTTSLTRLKEYQQHHQRQYLQQQQQQLEKQEKELRKREKRLSFSPPLIPLDEKEKDFYAQSRGSGSQHFPKHQPSSQHLYPLFSLQRSLSTSTSRYTGRNKGTHNGGIEHKSSWTSSSVFSLPTPKKPTSIRSWKKEEQKGNKKLNHLSNLLRKKKKGAEESSNSDSDYRRTPLIKKEIMSFTPPNESRSPSNSSIDKNKNKDLNNTHYNNIETHVNSSPLSSPQNQQQPLSNTKEKNFKFPKMKKQASLSSFIFRHKYHHQKPQQQHHLSSPLSISINSPSIQPIKKSPSMSQVLSNPRKRGRDRSSLNTTLNYSLLPLPDFDEEEELHYMENEFLTNSPETTTTLFDDNDDPTTHRSGTDEKDVNSTLSSSMATVGTASSTISTATNGTRNKLKGKKSRPYLRAIKSSLELLKIKNRPGSSRTGSSRASSSTTLANDSLMDGYPPVQTYVNPNTYHYTFGEGSIGAFKGQNETSQNQPNKKKLKNDKKSHNKDEKKSSSKTRNKSKIMRIGKKASTATLNSKPSNPYTLDFDFDFDAMDVATVINTNTTVQSVILEEDMMIGETVTPIRELKPDTEKNNFEKEENQPLKNYTQEPDHTDYSLTTMLPLPPSDSESEDEQENQVMNFNIPSNSILQPSFLVHGDSEDINKEEGQVLSALSSLALTPIQRSASPTPSTSSSNDSILVSLDAPMMTSFSIPTIQPPCMDEQPKIPVETINEVPKETINNNTKVKIRINPNTNINTNNRPQQQRHYQEKNETFSSPLDISLPSPTISFSLLNSQGHGHSHGHGLGLGHGLRYDHHPTIHPTLPTKTSKQKRDEHSTSFISANYSFGSMQRPHQSRRASSSSQYSLKSNFSKKSIVSLMSLFKHRKK